MKQCNKCNETKELDEFYKNSKAVDGLQKRCSDCHKRICKESIKKHPAKLRESGDRTNYNLIRRYGITLDDYDAMFEAQNGCCKICGTDTNISPYTKKPSRFTVDHCHETGRVRGLLCSQCNVALGNFKDSEDNLLAAIRYLRNSVD